MGHLASIFAGSSRPAAATTIVAHRGAAGLWVENSLSAFRHSLAAGYLAVEFDVHFTRDRVPVVIHDLTVDRTTDGKGAVADMDLADLRRLRLTGTDGEQVPTLAELLDVLHPAGATAIVEIKFAADPPGHDDHCRALADILEQAGMRERVTISAFDWRSVVAVAKLGRGFDLTGVLRGRDIAGAAGAVAAARRLKEIGGAQLGLEFAAIDAGIVAACAAEGVGLGAWTPNEAADLARMRELGVGWIITDRPDRA
ncbi:glycerophosphoryl diester phosphodiesterase [Stella humosa]|uniref:Glycerophosphoryl diester phosphodiesterase n=1 Tax=Stella humosa TaxID=94 RepID=A0A3N1L1X4_9PROT|nr:glycerophosphodiester phosphodiesterase family protein [Stella humosa]ROP83515.1 glycerophosphoryl diester phosphodiesterase [Stella humosa]BBK33212.1 glycerophosphodiester phosphodiesterase [Stella humosa]